MKKRTLVSAFAFLAIITSLSAQTLEVNPATSSAKWNAKKVVGEHSGEIKLKSGTLTLNKKNIVAGQFVMDMKSISDIDLPAGEWHDKLIGHLNSEDFFSTEKYPESKLTITSATPFDAAGKSTIKGNLTIKDITLPIEFIASSTGKEYKTTLSIDRTKYGIKYGSGQFFDGLGDKMIMDLFTLDVTIATK